MLLERNLFTVKEKTYTVKVGHLGTPAIDDGVVAKEKDGSVTSLEASVGPLFNG